MSYTEDDYDESHGKSLVETFFDFFTSTKNVFFIVMIAGLVASVLMVVVYPLKVGVAIGMVTKIYPSSMEIFVINITERGGLSYDDVRGYITATSGMCIDKVADYCGIDSKVELTLYRSMVGQNWQVTAVIS